ncbi:hypothetical protein [Pseudonocardia sp. MH-G8]|uniref:hypothetical protein n=1 Tax=Pseudonocardia sp. MH-G8 TaxID=1854588 RepID=UPI000BA0D107|nr:hypothetical protein [Pseudonocardia sp. MH-G8]OZM78208.1 hypothetical protein CFP66_31450 [Pseudonocardia sp. MH-G8]
MTRPDDAHRQPDGPTPAREQLPLPRRRSQAHLDPHLRAPGGPGAGTPFTAFACDAPTGEIPVVRPVRDDTAPSGPAGAAADRAAAFRAGARRGGGAPHSRGPRRPER